MPFVRLTSKRQVTLPRNVLQRIHADAGDLLEVSFHDDAIELRTVPRNVLGLMGIFPVDGEQDFGAARDAALEEVARDAGAR